MNLATSSGAKYASRRPVVIDRSSTTLLCADAPDEGWGDDEVAIFADKFGARTEQGNGIDFVLSFAEPATAVRAAVVWQRLASGTRPRVALHMVDCNRAEGETQQCLQDAIDLGSRLAQSAAAGTIAVSAETYAVVGEQITKDIRDALVMTEMDEGEITHASILLAPKASEELSTFAGLGLT